MIIATNKKLNKLINVNEPGILVPQCPSALQKKQKQIKNNTNTKKRGRDAPVITTKGEKNGKKSSRKN